MVLELYIVLYKHAMHKSCVYTYRNENCASLTGYGQTSHLQKELEIPPTETWLLAVITTNTT